MALSAVGVAVLVFNVAKQMIIAAGKGTAAKAVALVAVVGAIGTMDGVNELVKGVSGEVVVMSGTVVALWRIGWLDSMARWRKMLATSLAALYLLRC